MASPIGWMTTKASSDIVVEDASYDDVEATPDMMDVDGAESSPATLLSISHDDLVLVLKAMGTESMRKSGPE